VLVGSNNPLIHNVSISLGAELGLKGGIEYKIISSGLLPTRDILDQETVSVEPGKENISNNALNSFSCKFKRLSSYYWGVAEIKSACISSELMSNEHGIRIVLFALRHLATIFSQNNTIDNKVFKRCNTLNSC
jgi:hypothetical protein